MKKITFIILLFSFIGNSQSIFKGLEYGMSEKEAKKEFKENKDDYVNVDLGNGIVYRIYRQNFKFWEPDKLTEVTFNPKGAAMGLGYDNTVSYLENTRIALKNLGYTTFYEPPYWNAPLNFKSTYGLLLINPEKTVVAQFIPIAMDSLGSKVYSMVLTLYNYKAFMDAYNERKDIKEEKVNNSGF